LVSCKIDLLVVLNETRSHNVAHTLW